MNLMIIALFNRRLEDFHIICCPRRVDVVLVVCRSQPSPYPGGDGLTSVTNVVSQLTGSATGPTGGAGGLGLPAGIPRDNHQGVGDAFENCNDSLGLIIDNIGIVLEAEVVDQVHLGGLINDLVAVVRVTIGVILELKGSSYETYGLCDGVVITVAVIGGHLVALLRVILDIVCTIIRVVGVVDADLHVILLGLCAVLVELVRVTCTASPHVS